MVAIPKHTNWAVFVTQDTNRQIVIILNTQIGQSPLHKTQTVVAITNARTGQPPSHKRHTVVAITQRTDWAVAFTQDTDSGRYHPTHRLGSRLYTRQRQWSSSPNTQTGQSPLHKTHTDSGRHPQHTNWAVAITHDTVIAITQGTNCHPLIHKLGSNLYTRHKQLVVVITQDTNK